MVGDVRYDAELGGQVVGDTVLMIVRLLLMLLILLLMLLLAEAGRRAEVGAQPLHVRLQERIPSGTEWKCQFELRFCKSTSSDICSLSCKN